MTEKTLFQQLVVEDNAEEMLEDIRDIDWLDTSHLDVRIAFTKEDAPRIIEELEELVDEQ